MFLIYRILQEKKAKNKKSSGSHEKTYGQEKFSHCLNILPQKDLGCQVLESVLELLIPNLGMWRNWYTRSVQNAMGVIPWRFESSLAHQTRVGGGTWYTRMLEVHVPQGVEVQLLSDPHFVKLSASLGLIAQLVERCVYIAKVPGSRPGEPTMPKLPMWSRRVSEEHVIGVRFTASAPSAGVVQQ